MTHYVFRISKSIFLDTLKVLKDIFIPTKWELFEYCVWMLAPIIFIVAIKVENFWYSLALFILYWMVMSKFQNNSFRTSLKKWEIHEITRQDSKLAMKIIVDEKNQRLKKVEVFHK